MLPPMMTTPAVDALTEAEWQRYQRHVSLPEVGPAGQRALKAAAVGIVGVGGLGCPAAYYLAAAGIGTLGLIDDDTVDCSNLQRQILFRTGQIGHAKVAAAQATLHAFNPLVRIDAHRTRLTHDNAEMLLRPYDLIIDGSDNVATRYLLSDTCRSLGIPLIYGSVYRFEGQLTTFVPDRGPCYRCLYPHPPEGPVAPRCGEAGVLGILPGVIGTLQAAEAIKLIVGIGEPFIGRLLCLDALRSDFTTIHTAPNPECRCQGQQRTYKNFSTVSSLRKQGSITL